jgi:hypothetical protein
MAAAGIHVRQIDTGVEYHFGAARNPSFAPGLTAFLLIWIGSLWLQLALDAAVVLSAAHRTLRVASTRDRLGPVARKDAVTVGPQ